MAWTAETSRLAAGLRRALNAIVDEQVRDLTAAWARGFDEISVDLYDAILDLTRTVGAGERISRSQIIRSTKLHHALAVMATELETLAAAAGVRITGDLEQMVTRAGEAQAVLLASQLPGGAAADLVRGWVRVDDAQIAAIIRRSTEHITARTRPLSADAMNVVRRELVRGVTVGSSPRATATRIMARAGGGFNGGLTRALAISRTESLDAARRGADLGRSVNTDVLAGWSWHCALTPRSCQACVAMDGTVFPTDTPGPHDHVNGMCTAVPVTKTWAQLGFDIPEPPSLRVTGPEWFEQQSEDVQRGILGPSRYDAWVAGDYPMSQWGVVRHNDGWRDSLQITRSPYSPDGRQGQSTRVA